MIDQLISWAQPSNPAWFPAKLPLFAFESLGLDVCRRKASSGSLDLPRVILGLPSALAVLPLITTGRKAFGVLWKLPPLLTDLAFQCSSLPLEVEFTLL